MDRLKRQERVKNLSGIDKEIETIESLYELVELYLNDIDRRLNDITPNKTLQKQIKHEMGFRDFLNYTLN